MLLTFVLWLKYYNTVNLSENRKVNCWGSRIPNYFKLQNAKPQLGNAL